VPAVQNSIKYKKYIKKIGNILDTRLLKEPLGMKNPLKGLEGLADYIF
jgi:hypothetical protein